METITAHSMWYIKPLELPDAEKYICDIDNIAFASTGFVHAWESNLFFDEACQLIVNAIKLFQLGYYDCAFYSLRQSIEMSIGIIYLIANPSKEDEWKKLCDGFESGFMANWLKRNEPVFKDIRNKMTGFFDNIRNVQSKMNKYIHKQGYASFYKVTRNTNISQQQDIPDGQILNDFENFLKVCIGAVAVYRLCIDALPIVLMEDDMLLRSGDFITEPYSPAFVETYIGKENIEAFKTTEVYKGLCESLRENEKQNEAVFDLIHYKFYNRNKYDDYMAQFDLCSFTDRIAMWLFVISDKISQVFVEGIYLYVSDVKSNSNSHIVTIGSSYYEDFFSNAKNDFNQCFHNVFLSRCLINDKYTYFEHNEELVENEIEYVICAATRLSDLARQFEKELSDIIEKQINK